MNTIHNAGNKIAVQHSSQPSDISILFCGGFKSSMNGSKALAIEEICKQNTLEFTRFDYSGHGSSGGLFEDGNIDSWLADTQAVIDHLGTAKKLILIGSSMGAWIATLAARNNAEQVAGLLTIAAAPDFTERLLRPALNEDQLATLERNQAILLPSDYDDGSPYPITAQLIEQSRQHCLLDCKIAVDIPVRMLHGSADSDVPYQLSIELMSALESEEIELNLIKNGDHRLSSVGHLSILKRTLLELLDTVTQRFKANRH